MDWLLALCIAGAFVIGMGLLLVIGFKSGEDSAVVQNARVITGLKERNLDLVNMMGEQIKRNQELEALLKDKEFTISSHAYHIRTLAKELAELRRTTKDFALDA
jgi:DNA-binding CsgD family transcriptional regulator